MGVVYISLMANLRHLWLWLIIKGIWIVHCWKFDNLNIGCGGLGLCYPSTLLLSFDINKLNALMNASWCWATQIHVLSFRKRYDVCVCSETVPYLWLRLCGVFDVCFKLDSHSCQKLPKSYLALKITKWNIFNQGNIGRYSPMCSLISILSIFWYLLLNVSAMLAHNA